MSKIIEKTLEIQAMSVNKYYRSFNNRVIISAEGRLFKKQIHLLLNNYEKILGRVKMVLHFYFNDLRKRDIDNYVKIFLDIIKNHLIEDDDQVYKLELRKFIGTGQDKIYLKVEELNEEENKEIDELLEAGKNKKKEKAKVKKEEDKLKKQQEKNEDDKIKKPKKTKLSKIEKQLNI